MDMPSHLAVATFDNILARGDIVHFRCTFRDTEETKNKYVVILNSLIPDDPLLYAVANSLEGSIYDKTSRYDRDVIKLAVGTYPLIFSRPTVISFRTLHEESLDEMRRQFASRELKIKGKLLQVHLDQANRIIHESVLIEGWKRNRCRPAA